MIRISHKKPNYLRSRGQKTIELPYLMSCASYLLDRRYWILGIRYPWHGTRFDLVIRDPSLNAQVVLVEAKYRADGRPVRPYEIERFHQELAKATADNNFYLGRAFFMTNTNYSPQALETARKYGIRTFSNVPLIYRLAKNGQSGKNGETAKTTDTKPEHQRGNNEANNPNSARRTKEKKTTNEGNGSREGNEERSRKREE
ncbi:MAG: hypothetical protein HY556_02120 [Euryarchaeota archaeon]|nr:hypothetical protein [Euryarchaeota archaeon]